MEIHPRFTLRQFLFCLGTLAVLVALMTSALQEARKRSMVSDCKGHNKNLWVTLITYTSRYGSDCDYPSNTLPPGHGGGEAAAGPNGSFWGHLWRMPAALDAPPGKANPRAVMPRPGSGDFYFGCKWWRRNRKIGPASLDFAGPNLDNVGSFPGARLSSAVSPSCFIGGDLLGTPEGPNHGLRGGLPFAFNATRFDGSVITIDPAAGASPDYDQYLRDTNAATAPRTP